MEFSILLIVIFIIIVTYFITGIVKLDQYERGLKERFGKYVDLLGPGWHFIIPFIEKVRKIDIRERVLQTPPQEMITKDNAVVVVDAVVFAEVTDPVKATYEIQDPFLAVTNLSITSLRAIIGTMTLDEVLGDRASINARVQTELVNETSKWGLRINKIEIQRIDPPSDLMDAMNKQKIAQQFKRATILEAEGKKQAAILEAEGQKQSQILKAEGEAQAIERIAEANAKALELEATAAIKYFKDNAILKEQLKVLQNSLQNNSKYILDSDIFKIIKSIISKS